MLQKLSILQASLISLLIFSLIGIFFHPAASKEKYDTLFTVSAFLFGIFIGFAISDSHSKLNKINEILKAEEGRLLFIYRISKVFKKEIHEHLQELIDKYLIDQIDYYLEDWKYSSKSFFKLFDYIISIKPEEKSQDEAYKVMINLMQNSSQDRKKIEAFVQDKILNFEWLTIVTLLSTILFFIFYRNDGTPLSIIISILLATTSVIIVLILRDLDSLRWKEQSWIWTPLENLFIDLDLLPYYPDNVLKLGRAKLSKSQKVRVAHYPNPYPNMNNKEVEEIEI